MKKIRIGLFLAVLFLLTGYVQEKKLDIKAKEITQEFVDSFEEEEETNDEKEQVKEEKKDNKKKDITIPPSSYSSPNPNQKKEEITTEKEAAKEDTKQIVEPPKISIEGIGEMANVNKDVVVKVTVESPKKGTQVTVEQEYCKNNLSEERIQLPYNDTTMKKKEQEYTFSEEGNYLLFVTAKDVNGITAKETRSFKIDKTAPDLSKLDSLQGEKSEFALSGLGRDLIVDESHFEVQWTLDEQPYFGEKITKEGIHNLEAIAIDTPGNESKKEITVTVLSKDKAEKETESKVETSTESVPLQSLKKQNVFSAKKIITASAGVGILFLLCSLKIFKKKG